MPAFERGLGLGGLVPSFSVGLGVRWRVLFGGICGLRDRFGRHFGLGADDFQGFGGWFWRGLTFVLAYWLLFACDCFFGSLSGFGGPAVLLDLAEVDDGAAEFPVVACFEAREGVEGLRFLHLVFEGDGQADGIPLA